MRERLRYVAWGTAAVALFCGVVVLSRGLENYTHYVAMDMNPRPVSHVMIPSLKLWGCWVLLAPLVFWLHHRWQNGDLSVRVRYLRLAGVLLVASLVHMVLLTWINYWNSFSWRDNGFGDAFFMTITYCYSVSLGFMLGLAGSLFLWESVNRGRRQAVRAATLEAQLSQARLDALAMQLQPHFLFNTLNAIASMIPRDPDGAEATLTRLGQLLRSVLETSDQQDVPLYREIDFLKEYLAIEQTRFGERLQVNWLIDDAVREARLPAFLLQPLVENAVKYAVAPRPEGGRVSIEAKRSGGDLVIQIADDGPGLPAENQGQGLGLRNTRERLAAYSGGRASMSVDDDPAGGVRVCLALPFAGLAEQA